jgi:hypothetical protein
VAALAGIGRDLLAGKVLYEIRAVDDVVHGQPVIV